MNHSTLPVRVSGVALLAVAALLLAGCAATPAPVASSAPTSSTPAEASDVFATHALDGLSAREIVDRLDAQPVAERPADLRASVRPDTLVVTDAAGRETSLPMPDDAFYLSIAPYLETTHDCYFHSLTTCRGELANTALAVTVTEAESGDIVFDGAVRTFDNGFAGLWLPRDIEGTITVTLDGRTASSAISTRAADDATCLTTLHLV